MAGSSWPSLTAGKIARASDVESKFDWLEGSLVPMSAGSTTDSVHDLGTTTAYWRTIYTRSIAGTSTAKTVVFGSLTACTTTANSDAAIEFAGNKAIILPRLSTAQLANLTSVDGMLAYNTSTSQLQVRKNGAWVNLGGTVYQAKAPIRETATTSTVTALNIASGGGRIHGVAIYIESSNSCSAQVILDGITVSSYNHTVSDSLFSGLTWLTPVGIIMAQANQPAVNTNGPRSWMFPQTTTYSFPGFLYAGWDFASTAVITIVGGTAQTTTVLISYSVIQ